MENFNLKLVFDKGPCKGKILECLPGSAIRIGRVIRGNTFTIKDPGISQKHLVIQFDGTKWTISDLDSSNGTVVNDNKIQPFEPSDLNDGDVVKIGEKASFIVRVEKLAGANVGHSQTQQLHQVSTRRTTAKKEIVLGRSGNIENDEQIDVGEDLVETKPRRNLPRKAASKRTSAKEDLTSLSDICKDPKTLPNINVENMDGQEIGFSGKQGQLRQPRRAVSRKAAAKKNPSLDSGIENDPRSLCSVKVETLDELNVADLSVPENQPQRRKPSQRAATKRSSFKDPAIVPEFPGSSKTLSDIKVENTDGENYTDFGLFENQAQRNLPPRAAARRTVAKNDQVLVPEGRENAHTVGNLSGKMDKLNVENASIQNDEPERNLTRQVAAKRGRGKKNAAVAQVPETSFSPKTEKVNVLDTVVAHLEDHLQRNPPQRHTTRRTAKNKVSSVSDLPGIPDASKLGSGTRKEPESNYTGNQENLAPVQNVKGLDVQDAVATNGTRCQEEKISKDTRCMENITLGEWFDQMEKHIKKKISAVADEVIAKLGQRQRQFEEFVYDNFKA